MVGHVDLPRFAVVDVESTISVYELKKGTLLYEEPSKTRPAARPRPR